MSRSHIAGFSALLHVEAPTIIGNQDESTCEEKLGQLGISAARSQEITDGPTWAKKSSTGASRWRNPKSLRGLLRVQPSQPPEEDLEAGFSCAMGSALELDGGLHNNPQRRNRADESDECGRFFQ